MQNLFCKKCGGETIHEVVTENTADYQYQITRCAKCKNIYNYKTRLMPGWFKEIVRHKRLYSNKIDDPDFWNKMKNK